MSVPTEASGAVQVTLDDLIALNDEILALARCGVPLERSLLETGRDLPGRLGRIATEIGRRLQSGESLSQVLTNPRHQFPPVYRAVVEAGIRSGRLPIALEGLAETTRRVAELRRVIGLALLYPLCVITVICLLLALVIPSAADSLAGAYQVQRVPYLAGLATLKVLLDASFLWLCVPLAAVGIAVWWWRRGGRALAGHPGRLSRGFCRVPWLGRLMRYGQTAAFCQVLKLLIEQEIPLHDALVLAGQASGDRRIARESSELAGRIERGEQVGQFPPRSAIPPLVMLAVCSGRCQVNLPAALADVSEVYRRRAMYLSEWARSYLPAALAIVIGGSATIAYAAIVLAPWFHFLYQIAVQLQ